ncbi:MAG TPA: TetR family transcriptional regulator [Actinomycetota bacterium]|nr:TetR family transcriptional regulator [Actinomycetota bacterium]
MDDREPGLRERKKLRTRAQLTEAAIRLFSERGFDGTTIEDIVEEVEVSPRTFFRYFDSKEDVVIGFFDDLGEELRAMLASRPAEEPPFLAVRRALGSLIDVYTAQADRVLAAKRLAHGTPAIRARLLDKQARWENGVTEELAARLGVDPDHDPRPRLVAAVALAAFSAAVTRWVDGGGRDDLRRLLDQALETVAAGLDRLPAPAP